MKQTGCGQKMLGLLICVTLVMTGAALSGQTAALAGQQRVGANLIGKIEGAEVITDAARIPKILVRQKNSWLSSGSGSLPSA